MTAGFLQRCQNSLLRITLEMMPFHAWIKIDFHKHCLLIGFVCTKCTLYCIWRILQQFLRTLTYRKGNVLSIKWYFVLWSLYYKYSKDPIKRAARLTIFQVFFLSISLNRAWSLNDFQKIFSPVRLICPACLTVIPF